MPKKRFSEVLKFSVASAFALVIALFWNEAVKSFFDDVVIPNLQIPATGYVYKTFAAIAVTLIGTIGIWLVTKK